MDKKSSSPLPAGNSSLCVSSGDDFLLLLGKYGGLGGVLFDARRMEDPLDDSFNINFLLFEVLILKIPCVHGIANTFELVFAVLMHLKVFLCSMIKIDRNISNKNKINSF